MNSKGSPVALSRETRRQLLQVGKATYSAVSATHWLTIDYLQKA
ncbi:hypothetical protein [Nostoc sp. LEGE 06077]|nr:hypothetical protein [Nostoc sp. LEGE 06077]